MFQVSWKSNNNNSYIMDILGSRWVSGWEHVSGWDHWAVEFLCSGELKRVVQLYTICLTYQSNSECWFGKFCGRICYHWNIDISRNSYVDASGRDSHGWRLCSLHVQYHTHIRISFIELEMRNRRQTLWRLVVGINVSTGHYLRQNQLKGRCV